MKNLRLHTCVTWAVLLKMASALADRRVFQPYGPLMCQSLKKTYSRLSTEYHVDILTCIVQLEEPSSNKVCQVDGQTSHTKIEGCMFIPEEVQKKTYPRLFSDENKMDRPTISQLKWTTGRTERTFPVSKGGQITCLTCSHSDKEIYFVLRHSNRHTVSSINSRGNVTHILSINDGDTIAVDGRKHYVFVGSRTASDINWRSNILRYDLSGEHAISQEFTFTRNLEWLIGLEADLDRDVIYICTTTNIYTMNYTGHVNVIYYTWELKISSIAYDPSSRFLYIQQQKDVKRFPYQSAELEQILACDEEPLAFDVNQDVVLLANRKAIWAVDLKSNTSRWSNSANGVPYIIVC